MPNRFYEEQFKHAKLMALAVLYVTLVREGIPKKPSKSRTATQLEKFLDEDCGRLWPQALLRGLRDADVPHDSNNKFTPGILYASMEKIDQQYWEYLGEKRPNIPRPE